MVRHHVRGGHRLMQVARRLHLLDCLVRYPVSPTITLDVPLWREENDWDEVDVDAYEHQFLAELARVVGGLPSPVTLLDCGADIGIFSVKLAALCDNLRTIIAFEPGTEAHSVLSANLARLPASLKADARKAAVSDFSGRARLAHPDYDASTHGQFIVSAPDGDIEVQRLDDLGLDAGSGLVMKLDVEGEELPVLRGARDTLARADRFVVTVEANTRVIRRTGVDPLMCIDLLREIRPCRAYISERPGVDMSGARRFDDLGLPDPNCNLICVSE